MVTQEKTFCDRCGECIAEEVPMLPDESAPSQILASGVVVTANGAIYCPSCAPNVQICRDCGCTDEFGCEEGCSWVHRKKRRAEIEELIGTAENRHFDGYWAMSTNTDKYGLVSDTLNELCKRDPSTPFAFNFWEKDGFTKYELRSVGDFDVSVLAKRLGGGGHKNAAGCSIPTNGGA